MFNEGGRVRGGKKFSKRMVYSLQRRVVYHFVVVQIK